MNTMFEGKGKKVTIYVRSEDSFMGSVLKIEAWLHAFGRREYAQYTAAPYVIFTEKGKRTKRRFQASSHPYILVLNGWNQWPDPPSPWVTQSTHGTVTVQQCKYSSHDEGWVTDFEAALGSVDIVDIVVDFRGTNSHERKFT